MLGAAGLAHPSPHDTAWDALGERPGPPPAARGVPSPPREGFRGSLCWTPERLPSPNTNRMLNRYFADFGLKILKREGKNPKCVTVFTEQERFGQLEAQEETDRQAGPRRPGLPHARPVTAPQAQRERREAAELRLPRSLSPGSGGLFPVSSHLPALQDFVLNLE